MRPGASFKLATVTAMLCMLENTAVWAEGFPVLPGAAQPAVVSKALRQQQPSQKPQAVAPVATPEQKKQSPLGAQAEKIKFQLNGVVIAGNHVYSTEQLKPLYEDKLHKEITVAELFNIVQSITNFYRNNGYIISRAILPPQHVKGGIVKIQIIEGFLDGVQVTGDAKGARCIVQVYGRKIKQCPPLQISRMEKYLLIANEIPATDVKAVLSPSTTKTGAADLTLVTNSKLFTGYTSYDNYGTRYIGPQQMTANVAMNSFITSGDAGNLTMTKTPKGGELTYVDFNYNMVITDEGTRLLMGSTRAATHPLFVLRPAQIDGLNNNYYVTATYPVIRTRSENFSWRTGFGYLDSAVTAANAQLYTDHIRSADIGFTYNFADRWYGANLISSDFRQGIPWLGYTRNTNPDTAQTSRPGGRADYTKVTLQMTRLQAIKGPWSLYGQFTGQWAFNPLLSSEQYTWGGSQLGRGYDVAELIGDRGIGGGIELRYDLGIGKFFVQSVQPYIFYDAGEIWNKKVASGSPGKLNATSTGIGMRFYGTKYISGNIMWTQTLTKQVAAESLIHDGRRPRVFFSIVASFN